MKGKIFISYRRASDPWAVDALHKVLTQRFGAENVFYDRRTIEPGDDWLLSLDREVARASAVVLVFSREWFGPLGGGRRRIDDPADMVRRELVAANHCNRPIIPVIVDESAPPYGSVLPKGLEFIQKHQFLELQPQSPALEQQKARLLAAIENAQPGRAWGSRFLWQTTWIALGVAALVAAWHTLGLSTTYGNAFARSAMSVRSVLAWQNESGAGRALSLAPGGLARAAAAPPEATPVTPGQGSRPASAAAAKMALIELDERDHQALLGGGERFDPTLVALVAESLLAASAATGHCGDRQPVAINLDLAPDPDRLDDNADAALVSALKRLAGCRPLVLACPRSVRLNLNPNDDMRWMARVQQAAGDRLLFTQASLDPRGLRHSERRSEPGVVAADIAGGEVALPQLRERLAKDCVCPTTPESLEACGDKRQHDPWDPWDLAVPLDVAARTLAHSLPVMNELAANQFVLIGAGFGAPQRVSVPGRDSGAYEHVGDTMMQAFLLNGAREHPPVKGRPYMVLVAVLFSWLITAAVLATGSWLDRNDGRFAHRVPAYLVAGTVMFAAPLGALLVAAWWPAWTWLAGLVALVGMLAVGRALLSSFETLMHGGIAWRSLREQVQDVRFDLDTTSALLRLSGSVLERLFMVACAVVALVASH